MIRSGTLNVAGIVGIGKAIEMSTTDMESQLLHYMTLRNMLYDRLLGAFPDLILNGADIVPVSSLESNNLNKSFRSLKRLPNNLNVTLPSIDISVLPKIYTVAFSSTSACSSGDVKPSYVLKSIGRSVNEAKASMRFGVGRFNTEEEVDRAADLLIEALES
jgi:cysteine desulfurase